MSRLGVALGCALLLAGSACESRSPFTRSPTDIALAEPCRYMGTFHKESRQRLEGLHMCDAISDAEWACMARELRALDVDFTGRCRAGRVALDAILSDQRGRYRGCLPPADGAIAHCAALADDDACECLSEGDPS